MGLKVHPDEECDALQRTSAVVEDARRGQDLVRDVLPAARQLKLHHDAEVLERVCFAQVELAPDRWFVGGVCGRMSALIVESA